MDDLTLLKSQRTNQRKAVTKTINAAENELKAAQPDHKEIRKLKNLITSKNGMLQIMDEKIRSGITDVAQLEKEMETCDEYHEKVINMLTELDEFIKEKEAIPLTPIQLNLPDSANIQLNASSSSENNTMRLPKIDLEKFHGDPLLWNEFWSGFEISVHDNKNMAKKNKMYYLKSVLKGDALNSLRGLEINDKNYDEAIKVLKDKYGKTEAIISAHMTALVKMAAVKRYSDIKALRSLLDQCEIHVRGLKCQDIAPETYSAVIGPMILGKIPDSISLDYINKHDDNVSDVNKILEFLRTDIRRRENNARYNDFNNVQSEKPKYEDNNRY